MPHLPPRARTSCGCLTCLDSLPGSNHSPSSHGLTLLVPPRLKQAAISWDLLKGNRTEAARPDLAWKGGFPAGVSSGDVALAPRPGKQPV